MKEIGGVLGINESRVSQIHKTAIEKMARVLHNNAIPSTPSETFWLITLVLQVSHDKTVEALSA
jgi:hypothetical protein